MTRSRFREAIVRHVEAERRRDIDAIMASISDDPFYIIPDYELRGRAAVRMLYETSMAALTPENADEYLRALDDPAVASWGENHLVLEYTPDYPIHYGMVVVVHFDGERIRSEHTYLTYRVPPSSAESPFDGTSGATRIVAAKR